MYQVQKKKSKGVGSQSYLNKETEARLKECLKVPIPSKSEFWTISPPRSGNKGVLNLFRKNLASEEVIMELRRSASTQPGSTLTRVQKLKKALPDHPHLMMLGAICQSGMQTNSADHTKVLSGLMSATKEAAEALSANGISLYNCEHFFNIYYGMVERLKRQQETLYNEIRHDPRLDAQQKVLRKAMKIVDSLHGDKKKVQNIIEHLKKKLKTNAYIYTFSFEQIIKVIDSLVKGRETKMVDFCTATEWFSYVYALILAFSRVPLLNDLVDYLLGMMDNTPDRSLTLRRISIITVRNFIQFRMAAMDAQRERMVKLGQTIFQENLDCISKMEGAPLYQVFDCDPYFNVAYVAELTYALYPYEEQLKMLQTAHQAMTNVVKMDMSKRQLFTESARQHIEKLEVIMEEELEDPNDPATIHKKKAKQSRKKIDLSEEEKAQQADPEDDLMS